MRKAEGVRGGMQPLAILSPKSASGVDPIDSHPKWSKEVACSIAEAGQRNKEPDRGG